MKLRKELKLFGSVIITNTLFVTEKDLFFIRRYIELNPLKWELMNV